MAAKNSFFTFIFISLFVMSSYAQKLEDWTIKPMDSATLHKLDYSKNALENTNSLKPLLAKLYKIKHFSTENAVFVHIGDSHIQADFMTSVIRNDLQNYFGNAGRGLVFPYQVAKSNAPSDIISNSKSSWKGSRVARADTLISCGISAFGIESQSINPEFNLELRAINGTKDTFDKVKLFMGANVSEMLLEYNNQEESNCYDTATPFAELNLKMPTSGFKLVFPTTETIKFYGASLEKSNTSGIIYHSIGANGAKYSDYTKTSQFWKQLKNLNADCYIISLGTNEAQDPNLTAETFLADVKAMVTKIQSASPDACIILTSPQVSYFRKTSPNHSLEVITNALSTYCNENNLVFWDLYNVCKGAEGARIWKNSQLLRSDLVHFSKEGYSLQGNLFVDAFMKVWNEFLKTN